MPLSRQILWVALLAGWVFVAASLLSFDPADPPTHAVYPPNEQASNWCGPAGAAIAYHSLRVFGWPVWALLTGLGAALILPLLSKPIEQVAIRAIGVLMATAALAGLNALLAPETGPLTLPGGLVGGVLSAELAARFNVVGGSLILMLMLAIGLIVAMDRWLWVIPVAIVRRLVPAAKKAGEAVGTTSIQARQSTGRFAAALATVGGLLRRRKGGRVRLDDIEDDSGLARARPEPIAEKVGKKKKARRRAQDADEGAVGVAESSRGQAQRGAAAPAEDRFEDRDSDEPQERDELDDLDDEELAGAPQVYTEQELRQKIAALPVRFGTQSRKLATEDDLRDLQNVAELEGYKFPGLDLLVDPEENFSEKLEGIVREQAEALEAALHEYRIKGEVVGIESGPVITLYHVRLAPGTRVSALQAVSSDVARSLRAVNIRIVANQAGKDTVGVEVPNPTKEKVRLKELMSNAEAFRDMKLPMFLGKDAAGDPLIADLTKMPHMLIAGTTGSGKSVCMNAIIMSFLFTQKPNELKLVLVDPKMVEMSQFKSIPHLMCPVVTEMAKAAAILEWAVGKMDERYELLAEAGCRDISGYNSMSWEELKEAFDPQSPEEEARIPRRLPYMVFIIDELADLMMTNKEVEGSIIRIAQKARAVGIHLILATQRPQANVVTGLIKSNMPCRIAFKVSSGMDSRIVLDQKGGELLLGQGDMLYLSPSSHKLFRAQGTLVDEKEIRRCVRFMKEVAGPSFERQLVQLRSLNDDEQRILATENNSSASLAAAQEDPLFDRAVEIVLQTKRGSVSLLQRRLAIGYTRASRLIDLMGIAGIIGEHKGSVAREVMITPETWEQMKAMAEEEARARGFEGQLFGRDADDGPIVLPGRPDTTDSPGPDAAHSAAADDEAWDEVDGADQSESDETADEDEEAGEEEWEEEDQDAEDGDEEIDDEAYEQEDEYEDEDDDEEDEYDGDDGDYELELEEVEETDEFDEGEEAEDAPWDEDEAEPLTEADRR